MPTYSSGIDHGGQIAGIGEQFAVERRIAAHPDPEADRIDDEREEYHDVGQGEGDRPGVFGALQSAVPSTSPQASNGAGPSEGNCLLCYAHVRLAKYYIVIFAKISLQPA